MASVAFLSHFTVGVQGGESRQTDTHRHTVHTHTFMPYTHKHTESHLYPLPKAHRQVHSLSQPPQPVTVCTGGQVDDVEEHVLALHHVHGQVGEADVVLHEVRHRDQRRSEEHTPELQSLEHTSYAAFCLKKKVRNV